MATDTTRLAKCKFPNHPQQVEEHGSNANGTAVPSVDGEVVELGEAADHDAASQSSQNIGCCWIKHDRRWGRVWGTGKGGVRRRIRANHVPVVTVFVMLASWDCSDVVLVDGALGKRPPAT